MTLSSQDAVLPETFLRQDLLLEPEEAGVREAGAIELAGTYLFESGAAESDSITFHDPPTPTRPLLVRPFGANHRRSVTSAFFRPPRARADMFNRDADTYLCVLASARLAVRTVELLLEDRSAKGAFALW